MPANPPSNHIAQLGQLADLVRHRREHLGLTQARLAALAGLSRATINEIETGQIADLGIAKVMRLLALLGLELGVGPTTANIRGGRRQASALTIAARTASTSYRTALPPRTLARALRTGELPSEFRPHIATLLQEASGPLIVRAVEESFEAEVPKWVWRNMARWAEELDVSRLSWAA